MGAWGPTGLRGSHTVPSCRLFLVAVISNSADRETLLSVIFPDQKAQGQGGLWSHPMGG